MRICRAQYRHCSVLHSNAMSKITHFLLPGANFCILLVLLWTVCMCVLSKDIQSLTHFRADECLRAGTGTSGTEVMSGKVSNRATWHILEECVISSCTGQLGHQHRAVNSTTRELKPPVNHCRPSTTVQTSCHSTVVASYSNQNRNRRPSINSLPCSYRICTICTENITKQMTKVKLGWGWR